MHQPTLSVLLSLWSTIGLFTLASEARAQSASLVSPPSVEGTVVDELERPIVGAKVFVENNPSWQDIVWRATMPERDDVLGTSVTDERGRFVVKWKDGQRSSANTDGRLATLLVLAPNRALAYRQCSLRYPQRIGKIVLQPASELVGTVCDEDGKPLASAEVLLDGVYREGTAHCLSFVSTSDDVLSLIHSSLRPRVKTDAAGRFQLSGLPAGQIALLQITHPERPSIRRFQPIDQSSPEQIETPKTDAEFGTWYSEYGQVMHIPRGERRELTVLDEATGRPAANVLICAYFAGEAMRTDELGKVVLHRSVNQAAAKVLFAKRVDDTIWAQTSLGEGDTVTIPTRKSISGTVRDKATGMGVSGVGLRMGTRGTPAFAEAVTDAEGKYAMTTYDVRAKVELYGPRMPYVLPVEKHSTSTEESQLKPDPKVHVRELFFKKGTDAAVADFTIEQYPVVKFRFLGRFNKPVANRTARLTRAVPTEPVSTALTDERGIAAFTIDRPLHKGIVSIACEEGFAILHLDGPPEQIKDIALQPSICVKGKISLKNPAGEAEPAASLPVYLQLEKSLPLLRLQVATTDAEGNYNAYLPEVQEHSVQLYVERFFVIPKQSWRADVSADSKADFEAEVR